jgi:cytosine/adenosine deaminase-related metal-dependent hydrolase
MKPEISKDKIVGPFLDPQPGRGVVFYLNVSFEINDAGQCNAWKNNDTVNISDELAETGKAVKVLMPGWCNPHTHLELSGISQDELDPTSFFSWVPGLLPRKMERAQSGAMAEDIERGLQLSLESGVTLIADTVSLHAAAEAHAEITTPLQRICYAEALAITSDQAEERAAETQKIFETLKRADILSGYSPHAPFSYHPALHKIISGDINNIKYRSIHLAETPDEIDYCERGEGAYYDLFNNSAPFDSNWEPLGKSPVDYLIECGLIPDGNVEYTDLGFLERVDTSADEHPPATILAHGNYLTPTQADKLMDRAGAVCWCPETHAYFNHGPYPWEQNELLRLLLGSDSLASSASLSPLQYLRVAMQHAPDWPVVDALQAISLRARDALLGRTSDKPESTFTVLAVNTNELQSAMNDTERTDDGGYVISDESIRRLLANEQTEAVGSIIGGSWTWQKDGIQTA